MCRVLSSVVPTESTRSALIFSEYICIFLSSSQRFNISSYTACRYEIYKNASGAKKICHGR